jgi:cell division protein FtsN
MNLIKKYNLTQYDGIKPIPIPTPVPTPDPEPLKEKRYSVQVEADHSVAKADSTMIKISDRTGYKCFKEYGGGWWRVFCGSFKDKALAEQRVEDIKKAFKPEKMYQGVYVKEVMV